MRVDQRQIERYQRDQNFYYWEISFVQFSSVPLSNEEYHEVHKAIEDKMQEIELRRDTIHSNNQHNQ
jgi:NTP pyrophosphatase (non-canonical NTP hydrolase)